MTVESNGCGGNPAHGDLALAADIHQIGAVRDDEADADQCESDTAVDRRGDGVRRADGAVNEPRSRTSVNLSVFSTVSTGEPPPKSGPTSCLAFFDCLLVLAMSPHGEPTLHDLTSS